MNAMDWKQLNTPCWLHLNQKEMASRIHWQTNSNEQLKQTNQYIKHMKTLNCNITICRIANIQIAKYLNPSRKPPKAPSVIAEWK